MPKTMLYMMRHGRAGGNARHILNGCRLDPPLTKKGFGQAKKLARGWKTKPDAILSSPMRRAMSTARFLAKKYGMKIITEPLLVEQDCGKWTGKNYRGLCRRLPHYFFKDGERRTHYLIKVPGGEGWHAIVRRAGKWLAKVKKGHAGKTVVAVSHGVFMHACVEAAGMAKAPEVFRLDFKNASPFIIGL